MRVLYVEDNPIDVKLVQRVLARQRGQFVVDTVDSVAQARRRLGHELVYDLALVDMHLPDGSGLALLGEIREQELPLAVVILTGLGDEEMAVAALKSGADDYVVKRENFLERLPSILEDALKRSQAEMNRKASPLRVLYAEPSVDDVDLTLRHIARHAPHLRMDTVNSAAEVLRRIGEAGATTTPYDILLLDYRLPGASALDLVKTLHQDRGLAIPVVLITGHGNEELAIQALRLGCSDYLVKTPGYLYKLPATLENATQTARLARERAALHESEARFRALIESSTDHLFMLNTAGVFLSSNDHVAQFGLTSGEELIGRCLEDVCSGTVLERYRTMIQKVVSACEPVDFEYGLPVTANQTLEYESTLYPILRDDKLWAIGGIARDVTKHKQLEHQFRQIQKMDAMGRLVGGVAHDFNNMLTVIITYAQLVLEDLKPSNPQRADIEEILRAGQRSADLTKQLLAFARQQPIEPRVLDINEVVAGNEMMLQRLIGEDIDLRWLPGEDIWRIRMDPTQINQILTNLAVNARDAITGAGSIIIETENVIVDAGYVAACPGASVGEFVRLSFSDSGKGISSDTLEHIFEPFFTTKAKGEGTGLGLSTIYGIVTQNGGFINVYSEPKEGTAFHIYLPRSQADTPEPLVANDVDPQMGTETILLVEDEGQILTLYQRVLEQHGYTVLPARTAEQAMVLCQEHQGPIDLLLVDVIMPAMSGKELQEQIATLRPGIKALFMSGYTANVVAHHGILPEGIHFVQKPISPQGMVKKVWNVLHGREDTRG